jgi:hypothetical protein
LLLRFTGSKKRFWLAGWQTGNGRGLGHGPANERKGPVKRFLIGGRVLTADRAKKRPLGASKGLATIGANYRLPLPARAEMTRSRVKRRHNAK